MTAGILGLLALAYESYVIFVWWFAGFTVTSVSLPVFVPMQIKGFVAGIIWYGDPVFGIVITYLLAYFGARRSDAKDNAEKIAAALNK
jgi:hypothetical protein